MQKSNSSKRNISELVNRFRYGKPLPPSERIHLAPADEKLSKPSKLITSKNPHNAESKLSNQKSQDLKSRKQSATSVHDPTSFEHVPHQSHNDGLDELQQRVEVILKESASTFESEVYPISAAVQSNSSELSTDEFPVKFGASASPAFLNLPAPLNAPLSSDTPLQDDILQRWRLRRKMEVIHFYPNDLLIESGGVSRAMPMPGTPEIATQHSEDVSSSNHVQALINAGQMKLNMVDKMRFVPAERPLIYQPDSEDITVPGSIPQKETRSVGLSVVPTTCAETQTSPPSSPNSDDFSMQQRDIPSRGIQNCHVSLQKVQVVHGEVALENTLTSTSCNTSTWADMPLSTKSFDASSQASTTASSKSSKAVRIRSKRRQIRDSSTEAASPTTTVVKQVVGARLFNNTRDKSLTDELHDRISNDCTESSFTDVSTNEKKNTENLGSIAPSRVKLQDEEEDTSENPEVLLQKLLFDVENETDDFPDDPLLKSLRQQRSGLLTQLKLVENKLNSLDNPNA